MRFVTNTVGDRADSEEFLQRQLKALRKHLAQFPDEERGARAMEWIGEHAARYRRDWERNRLASRTIYLRCADCPLVGVDAEEQCEIHEQWLYLLHRYLAGEAKTRDYVEDCLALLRDYKAKHAQRLNVFSIGMIEPGKDKKRKKKGKKKKRKKRQADRANPKN
jgi:hypothetical protein